MRCNKVSRWLGAPNGGAKSPTFIHVPKTGGTYVMQLESGDEAVLQGVRSFGHSYVIDHENELNPIYLWHCGQLAREAVVPRGMVDGSFVFATVRNIFSWLVSYAGHAAGWNPRYEASRHYDHANARKGFEYLVKVIANREEQWPNRKFIHCQLFSSGTDLIVDQINRQETLDKDLAGLAGRLGMPYQKKTAQRVGAAPDYRPLYTDALIDLVSTTWNRELELFGYNFEGCQMESALLQRQVSKQQKSTVKYCWKKDKLTVSGLELPRR